MAPANPEKKRPRAAANADQETRSRLISTSRSFEEYQREEDGEARSGFYDSHFKAGEVADLLQASTSLADEIAMLRVVIRRCFEQVTAGEVDGIEDWVKVLSALSAASSRLSRLVQAQQTLLKDKDDDFMTEFSIALKEARRKMGIEED